MKITSPIFLQQASRAGKTPFAGIKVLFPYANPIIGSVSGNGDITVTSVKNGEKISNTYSNPDELTISVQADANTWVIITGEITSFDCNNYYVQKLAVIKNTALTDLSCYNCPGLTTLDLSKNTALTSLSCNNCLGLTALDLSKNTALTDLSCGGCPGLTTLDLSKNTALTSLDCYDCPGLTALDLSKNTALTSLSCNNCPGLTILDLSKNTELTSLSCGGCVALDSIKYAAENEGVAKSVADLITANEALDGTVYTNNAGTYYSTIADAATAAGWTIEQL